MSSNVATEPPISTTEYPEGDYPEIEASAQTAALDDDVWRLIEGEGRPSGAPPSSRRSNGAPAGEPKYVMVKRGPAVPAAEVESGAAALEVVVKWGDAILHVAHLSPPRSFYVGEGADYALSPLDLGADRFPVALVDDGKVTVSASNLGSVEIFHGDEPIDLLDGTERRALASGDRAIVHLPNGLRFEVAPVAAGRKVAGHVDLKPLVALWFGLSAIVHGGILAAMFFMMPALVRTDDNGISSDQQAMLREMVKAYAEREEEPKIVEKIERRAVDTPPPPAPKVEPIKRDTMPAVAPQKKSMPEDIYSLPTPNPNAPPMPVTTETGGTDLYDDPGSDFGSPGGSPTGTGTGTAAASGTGTGTGAPPVAVAKPDQSRPASVVGTAWNCPFPAEADADGVDSATATIVVTVGEDGSPRSVSVVSDPGSGFGRAARQCALSRRYVAGLDRDGNATTATTPPIRVRFTR